MKTTAVENAWSGWTKGNLRKKDLIYDKKGDGTLENQLTAKATFGNNQINESFTGNLTG